MKVYASVPAVVGVLLGWLAAPALSYGDRAAAERVVAFAAYVQEEIFDASQHTIAVGCKPKVGRPGLRGGTRCTFGEFCEHIWRSMPVKPGKPPNPNDVMPQGVDWGESDKDIDNPKNDPESLVRKIMSQLSMPNPNFDPTKSEDKKTNKKRINGKLPNSGFHGNADAVKIGLGPFPNTGNNLDDYYKAMEHCGNRMVDAKAFYDADPNRLTGDAKTKFLKWVDNGRIGAELLVDLRRSDKWKAMYDTKTGNLDAKLGVTSVKDVGRSNFAYIGATQTWNELNEAETIKLFPGKDDAAKKAAFDAVWDPIKNGAVYKNHETALLASEKIKAQLAGCKGLMP